MSKSYHCYGEGHEGNAARLYSVSRIVDKFTLEDIMAHQLALEIRKGLSLHMLRHSFGSNQTRLLRA